MKYTLILLCLPTLFCCAPRQCLEVRLQFGTTRFSKSQEKNATLEIVNMESLDIKMPKSIYQGYSDDSDTEVYLEIQRMNLRGEYSDAEKKEVDYDYISFDRKSVTVKPKSEITYDVNLELIDDLTQKGSYRVRAVLPPNKLTKCGKVKSDWYTFEVK